MSPDAVIKGMAAVMIERLSADRKALLWALSEIQKMAESRKTAIRMPNGRMLGNFCRQAISAVETK